MWRIGAGDRRDSGTGNEEVGMARKCISVGTPEAGRRRVWVRPLAALVVLLSVTAGIIGTSGVARADTSVSNVTVDMSNPSTAAGARTTYTVTLTTATTLSLFDDVAITMPTGTRLDQLTTEAMYDGSTLVGPCGGGGNGAECFVDNVDTVPGGDTLRVILGGVINPPAGDNSLTVSTNQDTAEVVSPTYTVTPAGALSDLSVVNNTPTSAAGGLTSYVYTFTTSPTGGLDGTSGSFVDIDLPNGSDVSTFTDSPLYDGGTQVASCFISRPPDVACHIDTGSSVTGGDTLVADLNGVGNGSSVGNRILGVSTSSDTGISSTVAVTPAQAVTGLSVHIDSPTSAAAGLTSYVATFTTSSTGGLGGSSGSAVMLTVPTGTGLDSYLGGTLYDGASGVGACNEASSTTVTCDVADGDAVNPGDTLVATLNGVTNPSTAGAQSLMVSTTSDTTVVSSPDYTVTAAEGVSGLTATIGTPTSSAGGLTSYVATFTTSSTGGLNGTVGSTIALTVPANTGIANIAHHNSTVLDGATQVGLCAGITSVTVECQITGTVNGGDVLTVKLIGVVNPSTAGAKSVNVATTSDTTSATSTNYTVKAASAVSGLTAAVSKTLVSATGVTYTVGFKTATGLQASVGSTVTVTLPTGTSVAGLGTSTLKDGVTQIGSCHASTTVVVTCNLTGSSSAKAGSLITVTLSGVKNPATTKAYALKVATSSDVVGSSATYCIATSKAPCLSLITPDPGNVGTTVTLTGVNLTGATVTFNGKKAKLSSDSATKILTKVPTGATSGPVKVTTSGGTSSLTFTV
jgi:hypothetical protein